jgi:hypothetical protein
MKVLSPIFYILLFISCLINEHGRIVSVNYHFEKRSEDLRPCIYPITTEKYLNRFGYSIKKNFILDESRIYDFDKNGIKDSIAILSPWELNYDFDKCPKRNIDSIENRILIINLFDKDGNIISKYKFDKILSKDISYPVSLGAENIEFEKTYPGFILTKSNGQGYKNEYSIYCCFDKIQNEFIVDSIRFIGFRPAQKKVLKKTIKYDGSFLMQNFDKIMIEKFLENF